MTNEADLEEGESYGCWCCGEINGLTKIDIYTDEVLCGECGEAGILTLPELLGTINAAYEAGVWHPYRKNGHSFMEDSGDGEYADPPDELSYEDGEDDDENCNY